MKNYISLIFLLFMIKSFGIAQTRLRHELAIATHDTSRVLLMARLCGYYNYERPDSALFYGSRALALARKINFTKGEVATMRNLSVTHRNLGNDSKELQIILQAIKIAEKHNFIDHKAFLTAFLGSIYRNSGNYTRALSLLRESKVFFDSMQIFNASVRTLSEIGQTFLAMNQLDSAMHYAQLAIDKADRINLWWVTHPVLLHMGRIQQSKGNINLALKYFRESLIIVEDADGIFDSSLSIAQIYHQINNPDSSIFFATKSLEVAQESGIYSNVIEASLLLSEIYDNRDTRKALQFNRLAMVFKDSLYNLSKAVAMEGFMDFDVQERQYELDTAKAEFQNRLRMNAFLGSSFTLILIAIFLFINNMQKQKSKQKIEKAFTELKSTQSQLIQSEKMASLGELTAGIAHEIQNPLNFVNNFSEVSGELIDEMQDELNMNNPDVVREIAVDVKQNLDKINHHGQRASSIVKGMLEHSRTSSGKKELTDINVLADEYLRLAYHGLRAKDKSFNSEFKTEFDETLPKVNVIPQDIGRVLLNLINNAFYASSSKALASEDGKFKPTVSVSTKKINDKIEIRVKDNGPGIPEDIKDKIFQPFFTTKPTGSGTGLGLSLSYDIIKAHGGEMKVESLEFETGAQFIIKIPYA